ncbi:hypothetical protein [Haloarchaeobius sp. HRN-SO-5]|uniref:hypothetical protein n=1 Tax=Haloarchaeobius sp. HRN-SO-5 TaxID=3446118 RepID=UPI003EB9758F
MIERQERNVRRDGVLFLLGLAGVVLVEFVPTPGSEASGGGVFHEFVFGCSVGLLLSGIFRATDRQALVSTFALGVGFSLGAVVHVL